jgi:opacity protein-like surface antigen
MKKTLLTIAAIATLTLPALAGASPGKPGPYLSGFIGFNQTKDANIETTDFVFNDVQNHTMEFDSGSFIGGTGGYDFGIVRLEGELAYRNAEINKLTSATGTRYRGVDRNLGMLSFMCNAFFDLENPSPVTPYWGAGVGVVSLNLDDDFNDTAGDPIFYSDTASTYAVQAGGGLEFSITPRFSLDLGYRYFRTGTATFDKHSDLENKLKIESHNVALGFRAKF